ncbi:hypothetical protein Scep_019761 [Stephania cephalantha]|uniref:Uncharacterized protein n=1 Tax=Stephania cephalantha TaxID=152367 RepID=A0AAP0IBM1_9MAGN
MKDSSWFGQIKANSCYLDCWTLLPYRVTLGQNGRIESLFTRWLRIRVVLVAP